VADVAVVFSLELNAVFCSCLVFSEVHVLFVFVFSPFVFHVLAFPLRHKRVLSSCVLLLLVLLLFLSASLHPPRPIAAREVRTLTKSSAAGEVFEDASVMWVPWT
jgi:hypothetical protein